MSEISDLQDVPARRVAWHLRRVRRDFGYSLSQAAHCLGVSSFRLWRWEHGSGMTPEQIDRVARAYGLEREALVPNRAPVRVDLDDRIIEVGDLQVRLRTDASDEVMSTYLRVIRTVRGLGAGSFLALREDDLVILADVLGHEPERIEERLVELMGLSQEEAARLRRLLLKKRVLAPAAGLVMGVSLLASAAEPHLAGGDAAGPDEAPAGAVTAVEHDSWDVVAAPTAEEGPATTVLPSMNAVPTADVAAAPEQPRQQPADIAPETVVDEQPTPAAADEVVQAPITPEPLLLGDAWEQPDVVEEPDDVEPTTPSDDAGPEPVGKPDAAPSLAGDGPPGLDGPDPDDPGDDGDGLADDPVEEDPVEDPPADDPVDEDPVEEDPVEDPPADHPVEDDPVEEDPVEDPPADDPVEDDPVEEDPVEDPPADDPVADEPGGDAPGQSGKHSGGKTNGLGGGNSAGQGGGNSAGQGGGPGHT